MENPLKIVVVGHVDHGKSTLIGRILYETASIPSDKIAKIKAENEDFEYAFLLDALEEEQRQGITIDTTQIRFKVKNREIIIIDAPGHREFLKNMVSGAAHADLAILIVDAHEGIREQSLRHAQLLSLIGIKNILVVVNKLDLVAYEQKRFETIKSELSGFLKELSIDVQEWIPVSAKTGVNIASKSIEWYDGPSILDYLDQSYKAEEEVDDLRLYVQGIYKISDRRVIFGKIESGFINAGDKIKIYPEAKSTSVKTILDWKGALREKKFVSAGDSIAFTTEDDLFIERGNLVTDINSPARSSRNLKVNFFNFSKHHINENDRFKIKIGTDHAAVSISKISKVVDSSTLQYREGKQLSAFDTATIDLEVDKDLSFDLADELQHTSRFVLLKENEVIGGGIIIGESKKHKYNFSLIPVENREKLNGHRRAILSVSKRLSDENYGFELEKILFEEGIRTIYIKESSRLLIDQFLETGHVVILDEDDQINSDVIQYHIEKKVNKEIENIKQILKL